MASDTEIANLALSHIGIGAEIQNLTSDQSKEATACRRYFEISRRSVMRSYPWPFATKFVSLGLVSQTPTEEWDYSYRYPADCLKIRRILSGIRNDHRESRVSYQITQDSAGRLIYTDEREAQIEYTFDNDDPAQYPDDFVLCLSFRLAYFIAPRLTAGDPFGLQERMAQNYMMELTNAGRSSMNEEQRDKEPESTFERDRA